MASKPEVSSHYTTPPYGTVLGDKSSVTVTDEKGKTGTGKSEKEAQKDYKSKK